MSSFFKITQIDREDVNCLFRNLENFEKYKDVWNGLYSAGNVFVAGGKRRLKRRMKSGNSGFTGNLLRSFRVRVKKFKPGVIIGFRYGKSGGSHAHLVDRGTNERFRRIKHRSTGRMIANRFWSDTEALDYPKALDKLYAGIERAVNRINNRQ